MMAQEDGAMTLAARYRLFFSIFSLHVEDLFDLQPVITYVPSTYLCIYL